MYCNAFQIRACNNVTKKETTNTSDEGTTILRRNTEKERIMFLDNCEEKAESDRQLYATQFINYET